MRIFAEINTYKEKIYQKKKKSVNKIYNGIKMGGILMNKGIVLFATDDENIIKDVKRKIEISKNESKLIKNTSRNIIEHLFKIIEKNINEGKKFECEFEKEFCRIYDDNISAEIEETDVNNLAEKILTFVGDYNKNFEIEKKISLPEDYKIKINSELFSSFLKYVFRFSINSQDSYVMRINSDMNCVVNKEIVNLIISIVDKTNEKSFKNSSIDNLNQERLEFINVFMNQLLESCDGKFRINKIDAKLTIEIHLIKEIEKK